MPTVILINGYRFFFYMNDHTPKHIHVEKSEGTAKFYLDPVELVRSKRFKAKEIREIREIVLENKELLKTKWDEYFNNN